jgi:hypothetical protein
MPTKLEIQRLHPKGRARFCLRLSKTLPPLPSEIEAELGATNVVLINSVLLALESAADDGGENLEELALGLSTIVAVAERKAHDIETREYRPGNNYGFSGAADTYSEIYRYLSAYVRTLADAVVLDVEGCMNAFRGALKLHAIYSAHGDPKGAIAREIEEAEERSETTIRDAYASIPQEWKDFHDADLGLSSPSRQILPRRQVTATTPQSRESGIVEEPASVFVSFKNLDARASSYS